MSATIAGAHKEVCKVFNCLDSVRLVIATPVEQRTEAVFGCEPGEARALAAVLNSYADQLDRVRARKKQARNALEDARPPERGRKEEGAERMGSSNVGRKGV